MFNSPETAVVPERDTLQLARVVCRDVTAEQLAGMLDQGVHWLAPAGSEHLLDVLRDERNLAIHELRPDVYDDCLGLEIVETYLRDGGGRWSRRPSLILTSDGAEFSIVVEPAGRPDLYDVTMRWLCAPDASVADISLRWPRWNAQLLALGLPVVPAAPAVDHAAAGGPILRCAASSGFAVECRFVGPGAAPSLGGVYLYNLEMANVYGALRCIEEVAAAGTTSAMADLLDARDDLSRAPFGALADLGATELSFRRQFDVEPIELGTASANGVIGREDLPGELAPPQGFRETGDADSGDGDWVREEVAAPSSELGWDLRVHGLRFGDVEGALGIASLAPADVDEERIEVTLELPRRYPAEPLTKLVRRVFTAFEIDAAHEQVDQKEGVALGDGARLYFS